MLPENHLKQLLREKIQDCREMPVRPRDWNSAELSSNRCSATSELWDPGWLPVISQFPHTLRRAECRLLPHSAQSLSHSRRHRLFIMTVTPPHPDRANLLPLDQQRFHPSPQEGACWVSLWLHGTCRHLKATTPAVMNEDPPEQNQRLHYHFERQIL